MMADVLITQTYIKDFLPRRDNESHKYKNGLVTTFAGSAQYPGAARLVCHAAARSGAGGVCALLPQDLWPIIGSFPAEVIPIIIAQHDGVLSGVDAMEKFLAALQKSSSIVLGPGLGRHNILTSLIKSMLLTTDVPCLIDGDGLFAVGELGEDFLITQSQGRWVLTPHQGEWHRLLEAFGYELQTPVAELAQKWGCTILLKGFPSHIYGYDGQIFKNTSGNPAATSFGCGDVLSGLIAGYLAQGLNPIQASCVGIFQAGLAADRLVNQTGRHSLMASDILSAL